MSMSLSADDGIPTPEMNTTPLIDVMLVLLIMFIVTIPIQTHAVKVDLPIGAPPVVDRIKNKIVIDDSGAVFWNGAPTNLPMLASALERTRALAVVPELHLQPEPFAPYDKVDEVLAVTKRAGVENMGFVGNERYSSF